MKSKVLFIQLLFFVIWILFAPSPASASVPQIVTYQGYLTSPSGTLVNKTAVLQLKLYDVATGGTALWSEQQNVTVNGGQFSVNLGVVTPLTLPFDKSYYLGIKFDADQEMVPRQQFTSSPFSIRAATADGVADGVIGTAAIADGSVTATKLGISCATGQVLVRATNAWGCGTVSTGGTGSSIGMLIAGNGIAVSGTSTSPQIDVIFGGNGSANGAARSDHDHDAIYQKKHGKVAVVAQSGGGYTTPATALADAVNWCGTPTSGNPCLVKIMPGIYDLGTATMNMVDYIDVEGSGETNTIITSSVDALVAGVVNGANATLANLTVKNTVGSGAQNAIAIFNSSQSFHIFHVVARTTGSALKTYAFYNTGTNVRVSHSLLEAPSYTIYNTGSGSASTDYTAFNIGTVSNAGTLVCNASRDGKNSFYADTCPPFQVLNVIGTQPSYFDTPSIATSVSTGASISTQQANALIKAQFNNDVNPATISTTTFTVLDSGTGANINGTVQYDAGTRTATFTPSVPLGGYFVATITTGVLDMTGGKLVAPYKWSFFLSGAAPDTTPPAVLSVIPLDKSPAVLPTVSISATFNEQIDRLTNLTGLLTVVNGAGTLISGQLQVSGATVRFLPDAPLALGSTYTATVSGAKDIAGNIQSTPYVWSFSTATITAPSGVGVVAATNNARITWQPVTGATGYNLYWSTGIFNSCETTTIGTSSGTSISIPPMPPLKISGVTSPFTFTPPVSLPFTGVLQVSTTGTPTSSYGYSYSVTFDLTVPTGVTVANAISIYGSAAVFQYIQISPTLIRLSVSSMSSYSMSLPATIIFSGDFAGKTMADFSLSNVRILDSNGSPVSGMNLTIAQTGTAGTLYCFRVSATSATGESPGGYLVAANIDSLAPVVTGVTPSGNLTSVPSTISVTFSEPDIQNVSAATFAVTANGSSPVAGTYTQSQYFSYPSYSVSSTIQFQPSSPFQQGTSYSITISGVRDKAGNTLQTPYTWSFSTPAAVPSGLSAAKGNLQTTLTWNPATGATSYNIYWSTYYGLTPQNGTKISGITGTTYTHTGLTNGTTYHYVVTAVNGATEGLASNEALVLIDNVLPTVVSTTPVGNSTGVSISNPVCVNFSKSMNSSTWNNANVSFKDATGAVVNGSYGSYFSGCSGSNNLGFSPSPALGLNTTYTMTIGTGVQDNAGNGLVTPYSFSFTTAAVGTPSGLTAAKGNLQSVLTWSPASAATGYNIYWSTSYGVTPQNGTKISGTTGTTYTHTGLRNGTTYYYVVTAVNGAAEGQASNQASVLIDNVLPTVVSTTPVGGSTGTSISSSVCVNFSKYMNSSTWNNANVYFRDAAGAVVNGSYAGYISGCNGIGFSPSPALGFNTTYTMTIGTGVQDNAGNSLAAPYSFSFTTALATPMDLTASGGALQANLSWTAVAGASSYNIYWFNASGVTKSNSIKIDTGSAANLYSHTNLANGSTYVYRVSAVIGGNESDLSNEVKVSFDTTPPVVTSKTNGTAGSPYLNVGFNEPIDTDSVTSNTVQILCNGVIVTASTYYISGTTISWYISSSSFNYGTTYTATVSGVKDTAGNMMTPYSWSFTTADLGIPVVTASPGAAGGNQISLSWQTISGATTYNVYWSTTTGVTIANGTKIVGAMPPFTHTGLTPGTTYYYVVTADAGSTESAASTQVSAVAP